MNRLLISLTVFIITAGILMVFSSPLSATSTKNATLDNYTGADEHQVQFLSTSKNNLKLKEKITVWEPDQAQDKTQSDQNTKQQNKNIQQVNETVDGKTMYVTATAYTAYCDGCSGTTYTGQDLRANPNQKVIAVDPDVIPLGSKVWVEGYGTAIAGDIGGAIKGKRIDIFIPNEEDALRYGIRQVRIKILE